MTALCKGCGMPVVWAIGEGEDTGKKYCLDAKAPCYEVFGQGDKQIAVRQRSVLVLHFATCPKRDLFTGKNRAAPAAKTARPITPDENPLL